MKVDISSEPHRRGNDAADSPEDRQALALARPSCFDGPLFEVGGHVGQGNRYALELGRIDGVEEVPSNAGEVNGPRRPHLRHALRSDLRDVPTSIGRARRLRHESAQSKIVHESRRSARRQPGRACEVRHPQLAIRRFGQVHDGRVLTRCQTRAPNQVAIQQPWNDLHDTHQGTPELLFTRCEWFDRGHTAKSNLLGQANRAVSRAPDGFGTNYRNNLRKPGESND